MAAGTDVLRRVKEVSAVVASHQDELVTRERLPEGPGQLGRMREWAVGHVVASQSEGADGLRVAGRPGPGVVDHGGAPPVRRRSRPKTRSRITAIAQPKRMSIELMAVSVGVDSCSAYW